MHCVEYKGFQWWATAVFEFTSQIPYSDFHFDFQNFNICLNSKYFNEITVQLQVPIALLCDTSVQKLFDKFDQISTEGIIGEWEE